MFLTPFFCGMWRENTLVCVAGASAQERRLVLRAFIEEALLLESEIVVITQQDEEGDELVGNIPSVTTVKELEEALIRRKKNGAPPIDFLIVENPEVYMDFGDMEEEDENGEKRTEDDILEHKIYISSRVWGVLRRISTTLVKTAVIATAQLPEPPLDGVVPDSDHFGWNRGGCRSATDVLGVYSTPKDREENAVSLSWISQKNARPDKRVIRARLSPSGPVLDDDCDFPP